MSNDHKLLKPIDCELVIGLVGAVGTQFLDVIQRIEAQFKLAGYEVDTVKVSRDVISQIVEVGKHTNDFERYSAYMQTGNDARRHSTRWTTNGQGIA